MRKWICVIIIITSNCSLYAQSDEAQQLLLNVEKLTQFKKILQNMKDGYRLIHGGYTAIKDISSGNFDLHKNFLNALVQVSPAVQRYKRIADIVNYQLKIVQEYKASFSQFKRDNQFTVPELQYMGKVYSNLFHEGLKNLDELTLVITAGKLRMSDDERLQAIDKIYANIEDQFVFLKEFNNNTAMLSVQRKSEQVEIEMSKKIHGY